MAGSLSTFTSLSAFGYPIPERSEATPGLWNNLFSGLSANLDTLNSSVSQFVNVSSVGTAQVTGGISTNTLATQSGNTILIAVGAQSIVGRKEPSYTSSYNVLWFGSAASSNESRVQHAYNQAVADNVGMVWIPAALLPFSASSVTGISNGLAKLVREGGSPQDYDVWAYGAYHNGVGGVGTDDQPAIQSAVSAAVAAAINTGDTKRVYIPPGQYVIKNTISLATAVDINIQGAGFNETLLAQGKSGVTIFQTTGVCTRLTLRDMWIGSFSTWTAGGGFQSVNPGYPLTPTSQLVLERIFFQDLPYPVYFDNVAQSTLRDLRYFQNKGVATVGDVYYFIRSVSCIFDNCMVLANAGSIGRDALRVDSDCDTILCWKCEHVLLGNGPGAGFHVMDSVGAGANPPRIIRFTDCTGENGNVGFLVDAARDVRIEGCETANNTTYGYSITGGRSVRVENSLAFLNQQGGINVAGGSGVILGGNMCGSNATIQNTYDGIAIASGVSDVGLMYNRCGDILFQSSLVTKQRYGISVATSTDYIQMVGNLLSGNSAGGFLSTSTGKNNSILDSSIFTTSTTGALSFLTAPVYFQAGTSSAPAIAFQSEVSLGWYRSAASVIQNSYGTLVISILSSSVAAGYNVSQVIASGTRYTNFTPSGQALFEVGGLVVADGDGSANKGWIRTNAGSASFPSFSYTQEATLGWYRSAASVMALSYGGLGIKAGTNASCGTAVLGSNGSVNVANTYVAAGDLIFLTDQTPGGTLGDLELGGIRAGSGFTIQSTSITDSSTIAWLIIRPT